MIKLNDEQIIFIRTLLEDELTRLNIKRSKSISVREFDKVCGDRMKYIQGFIKYLKEKE